MNWAKITFLFLLALGAEVGFASSTNTNSVAKVTATNVVAATGFDRFRLIPERNIFNPNRSTRSSRTESTEAPAKTVKFESFALVGTMLSDDSQLAFFDSSNSNYKKVIKSTDSIAGYQIKEVLSDSVKLEMEGKVVDLSIGQQMKRQGEGEWTVSGKPSGESTTTNSSSTQSSSSSSADDDEILKRLLKKREEEANK